MRIDDFWNGTVEDWDFEVDGDRGNGEATPAQSEREPDLTLRCDTFVQWVLGTYSASALAAVGALRVTDPRLLPRLDAAMVGPVPFNRERY
jgi:hypothetical protein